MGLLDICQVNSSPPTLPEADDTSEIPNLPPAGFVNLPPRLSLVNGMSVGSDTQTEGSQSPGAEFSPFYTDHTSSSAAQTSRGRKRPQSDCSQYALTAGRELKLKKTSQTELVSLSKLASEEREIWVAGHMLKLMERMDMLQPPNAIFVLPKSLEQKIDSYAFLLIMSPKIAAYVQDDVPTKLLHKLIDIHPEWGLPADAKNEKHKMDVVTKRVQNKLTDRRHDVKKMINASLIIENPDDTVAADTPSKPTKLKKSDIVNLCQALINIYKPAALKVTVQMCARIAFLRAVLTENPNSSRYWEIVDNNLERVRKDCAGDKNKISKAFYQVLGHDRTQYVGDATSLDAVSREMSNGMQQEADKAADGEFDPVNAAIMEI